MAKRTVQFSTSMLMAKITKGYATIFHMGETDSVKMNNETVEGPNFSFEIDDYGGYYYIVLDVYEYMQNGVLRNIENQSMSLLAVFDSSSSVVTVGAPSTVAAMYAFAQFMSVGDDGYTRIYGEEARLKIAYGMKNNFTGTNGSISDVISQSPNGLETNSYPMFNSLSTLVFYCMTSKTIYDQFTAMSPAGKSFLKAFNNMVLNPFDNVEEIYELLDGQSDIYTPSLKGMQLPAHKSPVPTQWTLAIKRNHSGALNFLPSGVAYAAFDINDRMWVANNFRMGSAVSGTHCPVFESDGSPAPFSPIQGGGLLGCAFGVAIDKSGTKISIGNFGWGPECFNPEYGSISQFSSEGEVLCSPNGITNGLSRVQGMCYDQSGNLWMTSVGSEEPFAPAPEGPYPYENRNSAVVVYLGGDPNKMLRFDNFSNDPSPYHRAFDVVIDSQGNAFVSNIGTYEEDIAKSRKSSVQKIALENGQLKLKGFWESKYYNESKLREGYEQYRQVAIDADDNVIVVGVSSSRATVLNNELTKEIGYYDKNVNAPWGITIDQKQRIYLASFAQEKGRAANGSLDMQGPYGITVIEPNNPDSAQLMTLPTGGEEVRLANGKPLYGTMVVDGVEVKMKSYEPLMRLTATTIDRAGNLWAMNNWKPSKEVDVEVNPGGDGVVIFVGVAAPAAGFVS